MSIGAQDLHAETHAEAASGVRVQHDAGPVPGALGPGVRLPDVAPNYAQQRSTVAKKIGLGTGRGKVAAEPVAPPPKPIRAPRVRKTAAAKA